MKQAVVYARALMEDSKMLFEAITPKKSNMPSSRASFVRDKTRSEEANK